MKKINIVFAIIMIALVSVSCETYDDAPSEFEPILGFTTATGAMTFNPGQTEKTTSATLYITDASSVDRTFTISVVESGTNVPAENYSFDSEIVILAGENEATFTITGFNLSLQVDELFLVVAPEPTSGLISGQFFTLAMKKRV
ncbi:hypothetical protein [Ulvibacter antarcticus]|uniref:Calx-beta domain-containing protein n=1 Tax=Ulvibacter antarcticus TaxID=442714 RepID=A0A3L9YEM2_9FLAO|nr:hypothetical protein [Ulvibacter antarcticus]RMA57917.1 hypothetical protein BXY75_2724 [Ulvibacter antarcticus]